MKDCKHVWGETILTKYANSTKYVYERQCLWCKVTQQRKENGKTWRLINENW